jgi:hypothetical protein
MAAVFSFDSIKRKRSKKLVPRDRMHFVIPPWRKELDKGDACSGGLLVWVTQIRTVGWMRFCRQRTLKDSALSDGEPSPSTQATAAASTTNPQTTARMSAPEGERSESGGGVASECSMHTKHMFSANQTRAQRSTKRAHKAHTIRMQLATPGRPGSPRQSQSHHRPQPRHCRCR